MTSRSGVPSRTWGASETNHPVFAHLQSGDCNTDHAFAALQRYFRPSSFVTSPFDPMPTETKSARTIFLDALERPEAADRDRFIDSACGLDEALRAEVVRLLGAHGDLNDFMDRPAAGFSPMIGWSASAQVGTTIGRYKLLEQIGEGGMGVVYVAEQTEPIRRRVALKIIKPGMDTRQVIARFEAERQALAMMDHPNIAKVLDGGTTDHVDI